MAAANPRRRAIPAVQRAVQRGCARKRARILPAVPYPLHSAGRVAGVDRVHRQIRAGLESAGSWRGESFPERVVSDVRRDHRDG